MFWFFIVSNYRSLHTVVKQTQALHFLPEKCIILASADIKKDIQNNFVANLCRCGCFA